MLDLRNFVLSATLILIFGALVIFPSNSFAHCDGMDGPVVKAAQKALETGNVNLVLIWVQNQDEPAIKEAFNKTLAVRELSPEAKELADRYFFETLVRVHRAGEGAPYTGLKPAGRDLGPAIPAADHAIENESLESPLKLLSDEINKGAREHFDRVLEKKNFNKDNVEAGREFIEAYVVFIHYVERLYEAAAHSAAGHYPDQVSVENHQD